MAICTHLRKQRYCLFFTKSMVLSHFKKRRFCLDIEVGGFVSLKISGFILLLKLSAEIKNIEIT